MTSAMPEAITFYLLPGIGCGAGLMICILLAARLKGASDNERRQSLAMGVFIAVLAAELFLAGVGPDATSHADAWRMAAGLAILPALPLSFWLYVRSLTDGDADRAIDLRRHLLAPAAGLVALIPFLVLAAPTKIALVSGLFLQEDIVAEIIALGGTLISWALWMAMLAGYGYATLRNLHRHTQRIKALFSNIERIDLRWVHGLLAFVAVVMAVTLIDQVASLMQHPLLPAGTGVVFGVLIVFGTGVFGLLQDGHLPQWRGPDAAEMDASSPDAMPPAYARSGLDAQDCARITARLDARMQQDRLWRDPFLSLHGLSQKAGLKPNAISQALNTHLQCNFFDYVNGWRVREACERLAADKGTVLDISEQVGFNAKSTFNAAFRKATGQTPTQYRASHGTKANAE